MTPRTSLPRSQPNGGSAREKVAVRAILGAFYKTVDVMKSAHGRRENMCIWDDDIAAVEAVMSFLEHIRDQSSDGGVEVRHAETGNMPGSVPGEEMSSAATSFERPTVQGVALEPCAGVTPGPSEAELKALYDWIREPDWAENFSLTDMVEWINRRPCNLARRLMEGSSQPVGGAQTESRSDNLSDPHPHWSIDNKNENYPKTVEEWDPHKDPVGEHLARAERRLRIAMDRDDPRAPAEMTLISRWDLTTLVHDWWTKCAVFDMWRAAWLEKRGEYDHSPAYPRTRRDEIARIIDPVAFSALERSHIVPQNDEFMGMRIARDKADRILALPYSADTTQPPLATDRVPHDT